MPVTIDRTWLNAQVDDDGSGTTGSILDKADFTTLHDNIDTALAAIGTATVGGSTTQVQFNDAGAFGGDAGLTYNKTTDALTVVGSAVLHGLTASSTVPTIDNIGDTLTIANDGTQAVTFSSGILWLYNATTGASALFGISNSNSAIVWQSGTEYSVTQGTAGKTNISGSAGTLTIQNKTGGSSGYKTFMVRLN